VLFDQLQTIFEFKMQKFSIILKKQLKDGQHSPNLDRNRLIGPRKCNICGQPSSKQILLFTFHPPSLSFEDFYDNPVNRKSVNTSRSSPYFSGFVHPDMSEEVANVVIYECLNYVNKTKGFFIFFTGKKTATLARESC